MKRHFFRLRGFPGDHEQLGETRSKARYALWRRYSEAYPCSFREFMGMCS